MNLCACGSWETSQLVLTQNKKMQMKGSGTISTETPAVNRFCVRVKSGGGTSGFSLKFKFLLWIKCRANAFLWRGASFSCSTFQTATSHHAPDWRFHPDVQRAAPRVGKRFHATMWWLNCTIAHHLTSRWLSSNLLDSDILQPTHHDCSSCKNSSVC